MEILITDIDVKDIRFPTSLLADGSDAMVCSNLILFFYEMIIIHKLNRKFTINIHWKMILNYSTLILITLVHMLLLKRTKESKDMD